MNDPKPSESTNPAVRAFLAKAEARAPSPAEWIARGTQTLDQPVRDAVEGLANEVRRYLAGRGATLEQFDLSLSMSTGPGLRAGLRVEASGCDKATATDFPVYMRDMNWPITSHRLVGDYMSSFFRLEVSRG